jgi:bidirectional [NiFe] hydrogenase diaphorase subunit
MATALLKSLPKPPSDDKRWRIVDAAMRRQGHQLYGLIEALHSVQTVFGFLDEPALRYVARSLNAPLSKVIGVATFYHHFTLKPQGRHVCVICLGTACYIKGSGKVLEGVAEHFKIAEGETTKDHQLSLLSARCIGACGLAPAAVIDNEVVGKMSAGELTQKLERKLQSDS